MYTDGFINLYDWDERETHLTPLRCNESFNLSEVEQVQHGPSKQFYRIAFEFNQQQAAMRAN